MAKLFITDIRNLPQSAYALILSNCIPIVGVLFWQWRVVDLLLLYWSESAIIGFFNVLKMLFTPEPKGTGISSPLLWLGKLFFMSFFTIHYGLFMAAHASFLLLIANSFEVKEASNLLPLFIPILPGIISLFISHGYSFVTNFLPKREQANKDLGFLLFAPYDRILIMQVTIIIGAIVTMIFGQQIYILLIFIGVKMQTDLSAHLRQKNIQLSP